ncbi:MAG: magnesium and cobalt transport protein CorA [Solirubrobacteraceae bacterium]
MNQFAQEAGVIVDCAHYRDGHRQHEGAMDFADAAKVGRRGDSDEFVWIDLLEPDASELAGVQAQFALNELAVEDAQSFHLRPKLEQYDEAEILFCVLRTAAYVDQREEIDFGEVSVFLSRGFVITVRQGVASDLTDARRRLERRPDLIRRGTGAVLWAILDKIVDDYVPVIEGLEEDVDQVEGTVFGGSPAATERIYRLRSEATDFYRAVHPLLGALDGLQRGAYAQVDEHLNPFFRDVNDHLKLVNEEVLGQRDSLAVVLQANMAVISLQQNELGVRQNTAMKQLTIIATIFLPLSFITGFFGMNFGWMVRNITSLWVFLVFGIGSLAASSVALLAWFRSTGMTKSDAR